MKNQRGKCTVVVLAAVLVIGMAFLLNGCGRKEPEESMYPLAIGVENGGQERQTIYYAWPQAGGDSGETQTPKGDVYEKTEADSLFQAQQTVSENTDKTLDFHHLKLLVLDLSVLQDRQQMKQLLEYFRENENMAWNTCVAVMDGGMDELFSDKTALDKPLGLYVEQMLNGREDLKRNAVVTVKDLMNLYENRVDTVLLPQLCAENGKPVLAGLRLCERGMDKGLIEDQKESCAYVLLGQAKQIRLQLGDGTDVYVQDIRIERRIQEMTDSGNEAAPETDGVSLYEKRELQNSNTKGQQITQDFVLRGNLKLPESRVVTDRQGKIICQEAETLLQEQLQELIDTAKEGQQGDLTGSFGLLAGENRNLWKQYADRPEVYDRLLVTKVKVMLKQLRL